MKCREQGAAVVFLPRVVPVLGASVETSAGAATLMPGIELGLGTGLGSRAKACDGRSHDHDLKF